jgi:HTH-type transcriptional regulator/antitoxin HigA
MTLKPIKSERDYRRALKEVERLMESKPNTPEGDKLEVLGILVEAWEAEHHAIEPPDPVEAIKFAMEQRGITRKDLEKFIGSRSRVAEILNRKRALTLPMIRKLNKGLGLSAETLIGEGAASK